MKGGKRGSGYEPIAGIGRYVRSDDGFATLDWRCVLLRRLDVAQPVSQLSIKGFPWMHEVFQCESGRFFAAACQPGASRLGGWDVRSEEYHEPACVAVRVLSSATEAEDPIDIRPAEQMGARERRRREDTDAPGHGVVVDGGAVQVVRAGALRLENVWEV